jgi:hypothetical protein
MKTLLTLLACSAPAFIAIVVAAPPADSVHIENVTYGGTGCPQGSVGVARSAGESSLTMIFDSFAPGSSSPTESRKNCQLNINLSVPNGFQFSPNYTEIRGYASWVDNSTVVWGITQYFSGASEQVLHNGSICLGHWRCGQLLFFMVKV